MASCKGTTIIQMVKTLRKDAARARGHLPRELHHYLSERILPTGRYPEEDHVELLRALARSMGTTDYRAFGRALAEDELGRVYKAQLAPGRPDQTLRRFGMVWSMNHDSGRLTVRPSAEGGVTFLLVGYELVAWEVCEVLSGCCERAIEMSGGRDPQVEHTECRARGEDYCRWRIQYEMPSSGRAAS